MSAIRRLKKLVEIVESSKKEKPLVVYPGTFLRYKESGDIYLVTFFWNSDANESVFSLASLTTGEFYDEANYKEEGYVQEIDLAEHENPDDWELLDA